MDRENSRKFFLWKGFNQEDEHSKDGNVLRQIECGSNGGVCPQGRGRQDTPEYDQGNGYLAGEFLTGVRLQGEVDREAQCQDQQECQTRQKRELIDSRDNYQGEETHQ